MSLYGAIRPILFSLPAECAHDLAHGAARTAQSIPGTLERLRTRYSVRSPKLESFAFGLRFSNPIGIAAGFDKNARIVPFLGALGFGCIEIGSVTDQPSAGNPKPRLFRLATDQALINRMGLNNDGPDQIAPRVQEAHQKTTSWDLRVGVNIAKTHHPDILGTRAIEDFTSCYQRMAPTADYIAINVSCPNTADGKTFESGEPLHDLLRSITEVREKLSRNLPTLVKFSSDMTLRELEASIGICESNNIDGYVLVNTSQSREGLTTSAARITAIGRGGLSGRPIFEAARNRIRFVYQLLGGKKPIIGVGGVFSAADAVTLIRAGASLIQVYTGFVYQGPAFARDVQRGLLDFIEREGISGVASLVGTASDKENMRNSEVSA